MPKTLPPTEAYPVSRSAPNASEGDLQLDQTPSAATHLASPGSPSLPTKASQPSMARKVEKDTRPCISTSDQPYTLLTPVQRTPIALLVGLATMFSPLTANIYLPCLPLLQSAFDSSLQLLNLTITAYVIVQGIAPSVFAQLSEKLGRRPVYLITFTLFVAASAALAGMPQERYAALLALRMVQSAGSSVSTSIGYAVVADIAPPAERGRILAPVVMMLNLGPVAAPVIGGPMCGRVGWRWVFWFLTIFGAVFLAVIAVFLPETNRRIVGNGEIGAGVVGKPLVGVLVPKAKVYAQREKPVFASRWAKVRAYAPNPFKSVVLIFQKDSACVLFAAAIFYMMYYVSQASLPGLFREAYGYNETEIGLCYLALGSGVFFGSQLQARVMDWNYKVTAKKIGWEVDRVRGDDLARFPIEKARVRLAWVFHILQCSFALAYGWSIHYRLHPAAPLVFQFFQGLTGYVQSYNALAVEIHRDSPSTASAAGNLTRCLLSAAGVAAMEPLMTTLGVGPFFTLLTGLCGVVGVMLVFIIRTKGGKWRQLRESS